MSEENKGETEGGKELSKMFPSSLFKYDLKQLYLEQETFRVETERI